MEDEEEGSPPGGSGGNAPAANLYSVFRSKPVKVTRVLFTAVDKEIKDKKDAYKPLRTKEWLLRRESRVELDETKSFEEMKVCT